MASITPSAPSHQKPTLPRFTTAPCAEQRSRSSSPSSCDTADGSRDSSRRRPSFGSIKEDVDGMWPSVVRYGPVKMADPRLFGAGIAQSFVDTNHVLSPKEPRKLDLPEMQQTPDFCCPCGGFLGWKQIRLGGKSLSRSYGDLRGLGSMQAKGWAWETTDSGKELKSPKAPAVVARDQVPHPQPGTSTMEKLPPEVLGKRSSACNLSRAWY